MDDDLQQLEAELKSLRPARPSRVLENRIAGELATDGASAPVAAPAKRPAAPRRRLASVHWLWSAALPVAAAIALIVFSPGRRARPAAQVTDITPAGEVALKPVAAENVLYSVQDEGLVTLDDGTTARRERLNYVDTITWKNPRTKASLTYTVPREEVRVVPISYQ